MVDQPGLVGSEGREGLLEEAGELDLKDEVCLPCRGGEDTAEAPSQRCRGQKCRDGLTWSPIKPTPPSTTGLVYQSAWLPDE